MDDKGSRSIIPKAGGVFHELATRLKLIVRLMADRRVNPLVKLLPVGALAYWLVPDMAPGPIDDALLMLAGRRTCSSSCARPEVVREHLHTLTSVIDGEWREVPPVEPPRIDPPDEA